MKALFSITDFMPSEAKCAKILLELIWEDGIYCPRCKSTRVVKFSPYARRKHMHRYLCRDCRRTFTDTTGTIFEDSGMEIREWFYIARELQRGISINQISKDLGRKYDTVMHAAHKIMESVFMKRLIERCQEMI